MCIRWCAWRRESVLARSGGRLGRDRRMRLTVFFYVAAQRRALGVSVVREFARHRLRRLGFIGVSLDQVREARDEAHMPWSARSSLSPEEADFFRFLQAGGPPRAP